MRKKKLLYVLHGLAMGGVEVALVSAIPQLNMEFNLKVVCLGKIEPNMISTLSANDKAVFVSFGNNPAMTLLNLLPAIKYVLKFNPDILICSLWRASMLGVIVKKIKNTVNLVSFIHSTTFFHTLDRMFSTLAVNRANLILTDSTATKKFILSNFGNRVPVKSISFLTNLSPTKKINFRIDLKSSVKFLYLGRIDPVKNIPLAIDTIHFLRTRNIQATLDVYGNESIYLREVKKYISERNLHSFVKFKGELAQALKPAIFSEYNFLIQLSRAEGMAMSVAEAMQNGLVCVVTPVGEIPNYSVDMKSAIFMNYHTSSDWAMSLKKLEGVIRNSEIYDAISFNCWKNFQSVKTYADTLLESIRSA